MTPNGLRRHAARRLRQRSIPPAVIDLLDKFGEKRFDGRGGVIRFFSEKSKKQIAREWGRQFLKVTAKYLDHYVVRSASDDVLITAGARHKRIPRR